MEQRTGSKLGKEYVKAIYCHPAYLTSMQSQFSSVAQLCPTLSNPMDCSLPGSSVKYARWQYTGLTYSFPNFEPVHCSIWVLTVASWPAYRFLKRQERWSGIPISFRIFHSLLWSTQCKGFGIVNKAEVDVFLELSCFFHDPIDLGNLISSSSAFSKSSLNIWKFTVHVLLKPHLENFEHYFTNVWDECNCAVVWAFFGIVFLWDWNENWPFPVLWPPLSFPNLLAYWVQHFHSIIF